MLLIGLQQIDLQRFLPDFYVINILSVDNFILSTRIWIICPPPSPFVYFCNFCVVCSLIELLCIRASPRVCYSTWYTTKFGKSFKKTFSNNLLFTVAKILNLPKVFSARPGFRAAENVTNSRAASRGVSMFRSRVPWEVAARKPSYPGSWPVSSRSKIAGILLIEVQKIALFVGSPENLGTPWFVDSFSTIFCNLRPRQGPPLE